jgi:hypothetical protein
MNDNVKNPKHYQGRNGIEAIDVHRKKNGIEDLEKAKVHMDWLIEKEKAIMLQLEASKKVEEALSKTDALIGGKND